MEDYYKTLGVADDASEQEIKVAFRKLAHQHHPDKGGDEARFKEVNNAYQTLSDKEKRATYDQQKKYGSPFGNAGGASYGNAQGFGGFGAQPGAQSHARAYQYANFAKKGGILFILWRILKAIPPIGWIFLVPIAIIVLFFGALIYLLFAFGRKGSSGFSSRS